MAINWGYRLNMVAGDYYHETFECNFFGRPVTLAIHSEATYPDKEPNAQMVLTRTGLELFIYDDGKKKERNWC